MTSSKKALQLIDKHISKLEVEPFDLEAWKSGALSLLEMLFDSTHPSITQIKALKVDYSSWALRDATAKYNPIATCKLMGKELLENAKDEIELYGLKKTGTEDQLTDKTLAWNFTAAEKKKLSKAINMEPREKRVAEIIKIVSKWKPERSAEVLAYFLAAYPDTIS